MHTILFYDVVDDYVEAARQVSPAAFGTRKQSQQRGELVLAGALAEPADGAILVFRGESPDIATAFAKSDPYVTNGLVKAWRVRKWNTVIGSE